MKNEFIKDIISKMSIEQKIGSLFTLGFAGTLVRPHIYEFITKYHCGGLRLTPHARLFGSYVDPKSGKSIVNVVNPRGYKKGVEVPYADANGYKEILSQLQQLAMDRPLGLPLHFSFDQEGGTSADYNFGGVNIFPKPMGLRSANDPLLCRQVAKAVSRQSKAVGFNWVHSPVLDVNTDPDNPEIYTRAYSDKAEEVAEYALQTCLGFKESGMIATGKHFPGRGHSAADAHFGVPVIDVDMDTLLNRELLPYKVLFEKRLLPSVMIAHSVYPAIDPDEVATVSKKVLTGLLRDKMGFDGVITTDSMTMGGIAVRYGVANACALALEAGADLLLMKSENELVGQCVDKVKEFVTEGRISLDELDEKVYRVLSLKHEYGLFDKVDKENPDAVNKDKEIISLSKTVARRSVVVERSTALPLKKTDKVLLIEQINKTPNDLYWHPGTLFKYCAKHNPDIEYLETAYTYDEADKEAIQARIKEHTIVILTNFYIRGSLANNEFIEELLKDKNRTYIVVTNTPYPLSIPKGAENVLISFATSPQNMEVAADALFGESEAEGINPITGIQTL